MGWLKKRADARWAEKSDADDVAASEARIMAGLFDYDRTAPTPRPIPAQGWASSTDEALRLDMIWTAACTDKAVAAVQAERGMSDLDLWNSIKGMEAQHTGPLTPERIVELLQRQDSP